MKKFVWVGIFIVSLLIVKEVLSSKRSPLERRLVGFKGLLLEIKLIGHGEPKVGNTVNLEIEVINPDERTLPSFVIEFSYTKQNEKVPYYSHIFDYKKIANKLVFLDVQGEGIVYKKQEKDAQGIPTTFRVFINKPLKYKEKRKINLILKVKEKGEYGLGLAFRAACKIDPNRIKLNYPIEIKVNDEVWIPIYRCSTYRYIYIYSREDFGEWRESSRYPKNVEWGGPERWWPPWHMIKPDKELPPQLIIQYYL